jgi:hypothetical protein
MPGGGPGFEGGAPEATWDVPEGGDEAQPPQHPEEGTSEDASQRRQGQTGEVACDALGSWDDLEG